MTTTTIFSDATIKGFQKGHRKSSMFSQNVYQVEVNGEDGDYLTFEIMADSCAEATATAEQLAMDSMVDIMYINVTIMG
ncbi:hypothetical protein HMPREF3034_00008 [Prevotella sp. DNF00663]|uniref:hypothetical protein n=1 Tax=Prevotella sp. DNF00663 TaxID=1384078 RepID=UPI00078673A6|nr:hypothetical protein [Prevotella sp. DNF00663]KXB86060.1 hypothetical protein HMPREF3034_00008 [Prevotella sp. DNF00663]